MIIASYPTIDSRANGINSHSGTCFLVIGTVMILPIIISNTELKLEEYTNESPKVGWLLSLVGIYFRKTTGRGNFFSKRRTSSTYPKIKTFRKLPAIRYAQQFKQEEMPLHGGCGEGIL